MKLRILSAAVAASILVSGCDKLPLDKIPFFGKKRASPEASLDSLVAALRDRDSVRVVKYIDVSRVANSAVDQFIAAAQVQAQEPGELGAAVATGMLEAMKPMIAGMIEGAVWMVLGSAEPVEGEAAAGMAELFGGQEPNFDEIVDAYEGVAYVDDRDTMALVGLNVFRQETNATVVVEVMMEPVDDYWRLVELTNLEQLSLGSESEAPTADIAQATTPQAVARLAPTPGVDEPWTPEFVGPVQPGMTREEVVETWGEPVLERVSGIWTFLHFRNGCEYTCGTHDIVFLQGGQVVDAIVRGFGHTYTGVSSSPPDRSPEYTPPDTAVSSTTSS